MLVAGCEIARNGVPVQAGSQAGMCWGTGGTISRPSGVRFEGRAVAAANTQAPTQVQGVKPRARKALSRVWEGAWAVMGQ